MKTLGNILWHFPFFGFVNAILVYLFGLLLIATVIASPIGLGLLSMVKKNQSKWDVEDSLIW